MINNKGNGIKQINTQKYLKTFAPCKGLILFRIATNNKDNSILQIDILNNNFIKLIIIL